MYKRATVLGTKVHQIRLVEFLADMGNLPEVGNLVNYRQIEGGEADKIYVVAELLDDAGKAVFTVSQRNGKNQRRARSHNEVKTNGAAQRVVLSNILDSFETTTTALPTVNEHLCGIDCSECPMRNIPEDCSEYQAFLLDEAETYGAFGPEQYHGWY